MKSVVGICGHGTLIPPAKCRSFGYWWVWGWDSKDNVVWFPVGLNETQSGSRLVAD